MKRLCAILIVFALSTGLSGCDPVVSHVPTGHVAVYEGETFPLYIEETRDKQHFDYGDPRSARVMVRVNEGFVPCYTDTCTAELRHYFLHLALAVEEQKAARR